MRNLQDHLVTQGKFLLQLWAFIAVIIVLYFWRTRAWSPISQSPLRCQ